MVKAVWQGAVLAKSENTTIVEGNHYFPPADVKMEYLVKSEYRTTCPWKGEAYYYTIEVDGKKNENAAWFYPKPKQKATHLTGYIAFWKGVTIETEA
jgi:uncharacterized protein (DUF427 family)